MVTDKVQEDIIGKFVPFSFNFSFFIRLIKNVVARYAAMGAAMTFGYQFTFDTLRHHDETNTRPMIYDHTAALTLISLGFASCRFNHPMYVFAACVFTATVASPITWWYYSRVMTNAKKTANIFYENDTTAEEVDRFRHQDEVERLAYLILSQPNYGFV